VVTAFFEPVRTVSGLQNVTVMGRPIEECRSHFGVSGDLPLLGLSNAFFKRRKSHMKTVFTNFASMQFRRRRIPCRRSTESGMTRPHHKIDLMKAVKHINTLCKTRRMPSMAPLCHQHIDKMAPKW
jgi:hypothetical protein